MRVYKGDRKEVQSCNDCKRGTLKADGFGLQYPYDHVTVIEVIGSSIRLCDDCLEKLKSLLKE